jgi:hypothetical protein
MKRSAVGLRNVRSPPSRLVYTWLDQEAAEECGHYEGCHSFVSLLSRAGIPIEYIAHLVGHSNTVLHIRLSAVGT